MIVILALAIFAIVRLVLFIFKDDERGRFFSMLNIKFKADLIKDKDDLFILINSLNRKYSKNYPVSDILEDYLAIEVLEVTPDQHALIKTTIENENAEKPFTDVPAEERRVLENISNLLRNKDFDPLPACLHELGIVLTTRYRMYKNTDRQNQWSIPVAIVSLIITIFSVIKDLIIK